MSSSSEDEAPETVSRAASRAQLAAQQKDKRAFEQAERDSRKAKNRSRAKQQQERTEQNSAAARMERAMRDAAEDNDHDEDEEDEGGDEAAGASDGMDDDDDEGGSSGSGDEEDGEAVGDEHMDAVDDDASNAESSESDDLQPSYLPDHLFKDALAAAQAQKPSSKSLSRAEKKLIKQKAKARRMKSKDVLLGDRAVRILPSSVQSASTAARRTIAPSSASTFVRKSLQLKKSERKRDWDRKTVDMGSSRSRHAPLHNFVRS
ncbi:hypothetical protein EXIGLDRAFT_843197 [Exidia glandulosa HHB12029]|uniref:Uncharacterized protein n=1 Tax=Exidia glandulosa HHB12029 TaxID=1314781 RepID=A0A165ZJ23_EXIGL|nr:hypothetical protein EXIGLDRAFT_843197 [Exidia glandulosa HHB12029]